MKKKQQLPKWVDEVQPEKPHKAKRKSVLHFADLLVTIFFLSTAVISVHFFRLDLFRTLDSMDREPVGIIIIKNNVVQRRHADRSLWDRLIIDSPVYPGDVIRAADLSAATVYLDDNRINMNENTLIRIQNVYSGSGPFQIELEEGNVSLASGKDSQGLVLNIMGRRIISAPGTVLDAIVGNEGLVVKVSEGSAVFIEEGNARSLDEGSVIAKDALGEDRIIPAAVMIHPRPNARFLNISAQPLGVNFSWKRVNIDAGEKLKLEIASDKNYKKIRQVKENLDNGTLVNLPAGLWYWRLFCNDYVLCGGQITVRGAAGPELLSPVANSVFRYESVLPSIRFQWQKSAEVSQYILQICDNANFVNPKVSKNVSGADHIQSDIGPGAWYWRVQPVFSSVYESVELYSNIASFTIEQSGDPGLPAIELPAKPSVARTENASRNLLDIIKTGFDITKKTEISEPSKVSPVPLTRPVPGQNYTVVRGDTLHQIAGAAYGFAQKWPLISGWNKIPNPDLIEIGDIYFIPTEDESGL